MQLVEETSGGVVRMGPATLYGTLKRLVDPISVGLIAVAVVILVSQRSALARSLHPGGPNRRRRHLLVGAISAVVLTVVGLRTHNQQPAATPG